jgi:hypothetical protein
MTVLLRGQIRYFSLFTLLVDTSGRPIPSFITFLVSLTVTPVLYHGSLTNNVVIVPFHSLFNVIMTQHATVVSTCLATTGNDF